MPLQWKVKPGIEEDQERDLAQLFRALGHPARIRIVRVLLERGAVPCGDLVAMLPQAQSTVSQHLRVLKTAGVLEDHSEGLRRVYRVRREGMDRIKKYMFT